MNILIDIAHPAQVHLFKNLAWILKKKGHEIIFTPRDKEYCLYLLEKYGFDYIPLGKVPSGFLMKAVSLPFFVKKISKISKKFKPDILLSDGSVSLAFVSKIIHKPHIAMEDTGNPEQIFLYKPFTEVILSPQCLKLNLGKKHIKYAGYYELAYLHPKYFQPERNILKTLGIMEGEKFAVVRFSAKTATHDFGYKGIPDAYKKKCANEFQKYARLVILSEVELNSPLRQFQIQIPPEKIHDLMYYASLVYTDGAKTACEAAVLGTPSIYVDFRGRDYTRDQEEKYGAIFNFKNSAAEYENSIIKGIELLKKEDAKTQWSGKREKIIRENIDLTAFMSWFIENYPQSLKVAAADDSYQFNFK